MGKCDEVLINYLSESNRFADLFNAACFQGRQIVDAGKLERLTERIQKKILPQDNRNRKRKKQTATRKSIYRDIRMRLPDGARFIILSVENQSLIDYEMPWRIMQYDCTEYENQIEEIHRQKRKVYAEKPNHSQRFALAEKMNEHDRLNPVYTICFYHGTETWNGPHSLKDMMDFGEDRDVWEKLFCDYRMLFVDASDPELAKYCRTDLKLLLNVLRFRQDKAHMRELLERGEYDNVDEQTAETIAVMTDMPKFLDNMKDYKNEEGGGYRMCVAMREIIEDAKTEGIHQGISQGIHQGINQTLVSTIENAIANFKIDLATACAGLGTTVEAYEAAKKALN